MTNKTLNIIIRKIKNNTIVWTDKIDQTNFPIHLIALSGNINNFKIVNNSILKNVVLLQNSEGDTALHIAARLNFVNLIVFLIKLNLNLLFIKNHLDTTPLYYVINNTTLIQKIFSKINIIDDYFLIKSCSLLQFYIITNNLEIIYEILAKINKNNIMVDTLITILYSDLTQKNKIKLLSMLVNDNNVNKIDSQYLSLLIHSVYANDYDIVKLLISKNADINYSGPEQSNNPLEIAIINTNLKLIDLLVKNKCNCNTINKYMQTPLHIMFLNRQIGYDLKYKLLLKCQNVNKQDYKKNSILNLIVQFDDWKKYIKILKNHNLNIHQKNRQNLTPYDYVNKNDRPLFLDTVYLSFINKLDKNKQYIDNTISTIANKLPSINKNNESYIRNYIKKYSVPKTISVKINYINTPTINITHYSSFTYNYFYFLCYLLKKYENIKIPSMTKSIDSLNDLYNNIINDNKYFGDNFSLFRSMLKEYINHSPLLVNHLIIWENIEKYYISDDVITGIRKTLYNFPKTKIILLKLLIIENNMYHANVILFDIDRKIIERFDPYGDVAFIDNININKFLKMYFEKFLNVKYISPSDTNTDKISFQILSNEHNNSNKYINDPNGFCMAWCIWYVEMKINNLTVQSKVLIDKSISKINKDYAIFKNYIRNYSNFLDCQRNIILHQFNLDKQWWYKKSLSTQLSNKHYSKIRYMFHKYINIM